jgi:cell division protease FtsH
MVRPEEDQMLLSFCVISWIITTLAGRVTVVFGNPEVTTGASNDLQQVTNIARQMVTRYGMSLDQLHLKVIMTKCI